MINPSVQAVWAVVAAVTMLQAEPPEEAWRSVFLLKNDEMRLPRSVQYEYVSRYQRLKADRVTLDVTYRVKYGSQGQKFFTDTDFNRAAGEHSMTVNGKVYSLKEPLQSVDKRAYDGRFLRHRDTEGLITQTQSPDAFQPLTPSPWAALELESVETLDKLLSSGKIFLASHEEVDVKGKRLLRTVFSYTDVRQPFLEVMHDPALGYLAVEATEFSRTGEITDRLEDVQILAAEVDQNRYFLPIKAANKHFKNGIVVTVKAFEVKPESVAFDKDIPPERFLLPTTPRDVIYDADLKKSIWDPSALVSDDAAMRLLDRSGERSPEVSDNGVRHAGGVAAALDPVTEAVADPQLSRSGRLVWIAAAVSIATLACVLLMRKRRRSTSPVRNVRQ